MKRKKIYSSNIFRKYFAYALIFFAIVFSLFSYLIYQIYDTHNQKKSKQYQVVAAQVDRQVSTFFDEAKRIAFTIGNQLSGLEKKDFKDAKNIFGTFFPHNKDDLYFLCFFYKENNQDFAYNSRLGLVLLEKNRPYRSYIEKCKKHPWKLHFSKPSIGITTGLWILPVGMGITNENGEFLGTLTIGFNIAEINTKLNSTEITGENSFILLDHKHRIIFQSPDNAIDPKSIYYRDFFKKSKDFFHDQRKLESPIIYDDISYQYYKKMEAYPYTILTGSNKTVIKDDYQKLILPRVIEFILVFILCIGLIRLFYTNIVESTKKSEQEREKFTTQLNKEMRKSLDTIIKYSYLMMASSQKGLKIDSSQSLRLSQAIHESALTMQELTTSILNLSDVSVNDVIQKCVTIQNKTAMLKRVQIIANLNENTPPLCADELRLKQVILSLLNYSIEATPKGGSISISTSFMDKKHEKFLTIEIKDDGFGLSEEDFLIIDDKFGSPGLHSLDGSGLNFSSIKKLIHMHHGTCEVQNLSVDGKIIKLRFPYLKKHQHKTFCQSTQSESNIFYLSEITKDSL